jgi:hypothetical protein
MRMKTKILVLLCIYINTVGCGGQQNSEDENNQYKPYQCPNPGDSNLEGFEANRDRLESESKRDTVTVTKPSKLNWSIAQTEKAWNLKIDNTEYVMGFNETENNWAVTSNEADASIKVGIFTFFISSRENAVDSDHCSSLGLRFEVLHQEKLESYEMVPGIL